MSGVRSRGAPRGRGGRGRPWRGRGRGKRKFAPQGSWRQHTQGYQDEGAEWFPIFQRPHSVPFPAAAAPQATGKGSQQARTLVEKAMEMWGGDSVYSEEVIAGIFQNAKKSNFSYRVVMALEFSQYLERYLWRHFMLERVSPAYLMSIVLMVNEKWRQGVPPWRVFVENPGEFPHFMHFVMDACTSGLKDAKYTLKEQTLLLIFVDHAFNSLEVDVVREQIQKFVSLPIWEHLHTSRLEQELGAVPKLKKYWSIIQKRDKALDEVAMARVKKERGFLWSIMKRFVEVLDSIPASGDVDEDAVSYCERFLELLTDLVAQLPTRRFFNTLMESSHVLLHCSMSGLVGRDPQGHLFKQLLHRLLFYTGFEINDQTGSSLTDHEMTDIHYDKITSLQRAAFKLFPDLRGFALSNVASVDSREALLKHFSVLSQQTLHEIASRIHLVARDDPPLEFGLLLELLVNEHQRRPSQLEAINTMPLYPTEEVLWDINLVPSEFYNGETCLALPKLNLQFLTLHDYLLRNYELFRLESTYEIREDIEDAVSRLKPWVNTEGVTEFSGWSRMAIPVSSFSVVEVGAPNVGENRPSRVRADIAVELTMTDHIKMEWEGLRKHDVCFLISVRAKMSLRDQFDWNQPFVSQVGLEYVRGCEVEGMLDEHGRVIEEGPEPKPQLSGTSRTFRVWLDTNQYQKDMSSVVKGEEDVYEAFNILMRRKPKENNFKAVLETIRDLMNAECVVPDWLHDVFLGYGNPGAAQYKQMPNCDPHLDFNDTFLSFEHLVDSFPDYEIKCSVVDTSKRVPPFKLVFPSAKLIGRKRKKGDEEGADPALDEKPCLEVQPYSIPNRGPYPFNQPKK